MTEPTIPQSSREAAADLALDRHNNLFLGHLPRFALDEAQSIREGRMDNHSFVRAFANYHTFLRNNPDA